MATKFECDWEDGSGCDNTGGTYTWSTEAGEKAGDFEEDTSSKIFGSDSLHYDDGGDQGRYIQDQPLNDQFVGLRVAFNLDSEGMSSGQTINFLEVMDNGGADLVRLQWYDNSGQLQVNVDSYSGSAWDNVGAIDISLDTTYQLVLKWDRNASGGCAFKLYQENGTTQVGTEQTLSGTTKDQSAGYIWLGEKKVAWRPWAAYFDAVLLTDTYAYPDTIQAGAIGVSPNDCQHSQSCESPAVVPVFSVSPSDCQHSQSCESPTVTLGVYNVSPADCQHGQTCEVPTYTPIFAVAPAACQHSQSVESPAYVPTFAANPSDCQHSQTSESPTYTTVFAATPNDCQHSQSCEAPTYTPIFAVAPNDCQHGQSCESPNVSVGSIAVSPADCQHGQTCEAPTYTPIFAVGPNDCQHGQSVEVPTYTPIFAASPADCQHNQSCEIPTYTPIFGVAPADCQHNQSAESPGYTCAFGIAPADCQHSQSCESPTIFNVYDASPANCQHGALSVAAMMMDLNSGEFFIRNGNNLIGI